jgi:DNA polymerase III epsilon subunit family exonuclease
MYHAQPCLTDITFVALDTETTGLQPIVHRLVDIGAVRFRLDGWELATFQQLIDPEIPIPPEVQQVHGITDAMVRRKPTIEHVLPQFIEFLGESDTILLAHNAPFDLSFLAMALIRLGIAYPPHHVFDMSVTVLSRVTRHASIGPWACISAGDRRGELAPDGHGTASSHGDHCRGSS